MRVCPRNGTFLRRTWRDALPRRRTCRSALVVAAFDTELFGHWWYEGPEFLDAILRLLPQAGVQLRTLSSAREAGLVASSIDLPASSWGAGKDWRVWDNEQVADLVDDSAHAQKRLFTLLDARDGRFAGR